MYFKIEIDFQLIANLSNKEGICGDCIWEETNYRPKYFIVRLDSKLPEQDYLTTLAHELVHVRQYARGDLYDYCQKDGIRWKGTKYLSIHDEEDHEDHPWEKEATKLETSLYDEFCLYLKV